jgi:hypothetical protein
MRRDRQWSRGRHEIGDRTMSGNRLLGKGWVVAVAALFVATATDASAQTVNVAGTWAMEVTTEAGGTTTPSMTLQQDGTRLTGQYTSETLGNAEIRGTVEGSRVTINFSASLQGQPVPVTYTATVGADGVMTGTIDLAGGLATGTFTARRR